MYVMRIRWIMFLVGALLASPASAAPDGSIDVVRNLAVRVGPVVGGALACRNIVRSRLQVIVGKSHTVSRDAAGNEAQRSDLRGCSIAASTRLGSTSPLTLNDFCGTARRRAEAAAHGAFDSTSS
jgi:hypothetical protein